MGDRRQAMGREGMEEPTQSEMGRETSDPNTPVTLVVAVVGAILLVVVVVLLEAYFLRAEHEENARKVVAVAPEELAQARAAQLALLHSYRWVDEKQGIAAIPIERAIELVAAEQGTHPGSGGKSAAATRPAR
jgi:hypothetical protein